MPVLPDSEQTLSKSSWAFLSGTFLSRVTGLGRDMAMAFVFGATPAIAAFMVAFRFANFFRRLFGEGALASGFIPHFEEVRGRAPEEGAKVFRDLFFSLGLFLSGLILLIEGALFCFGDDSEIVYLTALMLPGVLFICLFGLCSGLLQCEKRYFGTGVAPVAFNCVWIAAAFYVKGTVGLSVAIVLGFLMQWLMILPQTLRIVQPLLGWRECLRPRLFSRELRQMVVPFLLSIVGVAAVQVNSTLDAVFARCASLEGPAYLWYAIRIQQLPLALFGIALSAALLPPLARAMKEKNSGQFFKLLRFAVRRSFALIFPCTVGIFILGVSGINLLYGHGDFGREATVQTVHCLWGYGLGLLPAVFVLLLAPAFFANKEYRIPMMGSLLSVLLNLIVTSVLVFGLRWGPLSIALATSLCAWFNYGYLSRSLRIKFGEAMLDAETRAGFMRVSLCALSAGVLTFGAGHILLHDATLGVLLGREALFVRGVSVQLMHFSVLGGVFVVSLVGLAFVWRVEEILVLFLKRREGCL